MTARQFVQVIPMVPGAINWIRLPHPLPETVHEGFDKIGELLNGRIGGRTGQVGPEDGDLYWCSGLVHVVNSLLFAYHMGSMSHVESITTTCWFQLFGNNQIGDDQEQRAHDMINAANWDVASPWIELANTITDHYMKTGPDAEGRDQTFRRMAFVIISALVFRSAQVGGHGEVFDSFVAMMIEHEDMAGQELRTRWSELTN